MQSVRMDRAMRISTREKPEGGVEEEDRRDEEKMDTESSSG